MKSQAYKEEMVEKLKHDMPMATPVFDGVNDGDIDKEFEKAGLNQSTQVLPYDLVMRPKTFWICYALPKRSVLV